MKKKRKEPEQIMPEAEAPAGPHTCVNCGNVFTKTYCNNCGQHFDTKRLTTKELWDNITFSFFNFDRGIPNTIKKLFSNPGGMMKEYIEGHRVNYSHPIALLLLLCTIYGIVVGLIYSVYPESYEDPVQIMGVDTGDGAFVRMVSYILNRLANSSLFMAIVPVPFYAWFSRRFFRKYGSRNYNYAEMLFICLYMAAQRMAFSIIIQPFILSFPDLGILNLLKNAGYVLLAAWTFRCLFDVKLGWGNAIWKSILVFLVSLIVLGVIMLALIIVVWILVLLIGVLF